MGGNGTVHPLRTLVIVSKIAASSIKHLLLQLAHHGETSSETKLC